MIERKQFHRKGRQGRKEEIVWPLCRILEAYTTHARLSHVYQKPVKFTLRPWRPLRLILGKTLLAGMRCQHMLGDCQSQSFHRVFQSFNVRFEARLP